MGFNSAFKGLRNARTKASCNVKSYRSFGKIFSIYIYKHTTTTTTKHTHTHTHTHTKLQIVAENYVAPLLWHVAHCIISEKRSKNTRNSTNSSSVRRKILLRSMLYCWQYNILLVPNCNSPNCCAAWQKERQHKLCAQLHFDPRFITHATQVRAY